MTRQLFRELDFIGDSKAYKQILDGAYQAPAGTDKYTLDYLEALQWPTYLRNTPKASITTVQF